MYRTTVNQLTTLALAGLLAACGGGADTSAPPPPLDVSNLTGPYVVALTSGGGPNPRVTCPTLVLIIEPPAVRTAPDDPCFGAAGAVGEVRVPTQDVVLLATLGLTVFHFTRFTGTAGRPAAHWQGPCTEPIGSGGLGCFDEAGPSQWRRP